MTAEAANTPGPCPPPISDLGYVGAAEAVRTRGMGKEGSRERGRAPPSPPDV